MKVPFTKAHGARNDFLLTPRESVPEGEKTTSVPESPRYAFSSSRISSMRSSSASSSPTAIAERIKPVTPNAAA